MTHEPRHPTLEELEAGLDEIRMSPKDAGPVELIVRRPGIDGRQVLTTAELSLTDGLVGDSWKTRSSKRTSDGSPHPDMQLNVMNSRVIALLAQRKDRWQLAGDQLFVDLDLSDTNLPPGTRLSVGSAVIETTDQPHRGCKKFASRFGADALRFVNPELGGRLRLRGVNAKVVRPGVIHVGDVIRKE